MLALAVLVARRMIGRPASVSKSRAVLIRAVKSNGAASFLKWGRSCPTGI